MNRSILYKALLARDKRFDGRFYVGVATTGIYCRPVCPARPLLKNVRFYRSPAEAEGAGFRPCLRCRPDLSPAAPLFQGTAAVVGRALRLIAEGGADDALPGLAARLGITDRHLRRLFAEHVGAAPVEVASSKRLHLARLLLSQTKLPITDVAFASGFRSLRRFNQAFRERYRRPPREFRRAGGPKSSDRIELSLPYLTPYDWASLERFLRRHAVPGVERMVEGRYERLLPGDGRLVVRPSPIAGELAVALEGAGVESLRDVILRVRHLFDLDHNPAWMKKPLGGLRVPGAFDGFETAVGIVLGQLVSVESAAASARRLTEKFGAPAKTPWPGLTHHFPTAATLARADIAACGLTKSKARAIRELARPVHSGELRLTRSAPLAETRARLTEIPGIGAWTEELIALRCLGDPDAFPAGDLVVARALQSSSTQPDGWRPWRGYLTLWLWKTSHKEKK